MTQQDGGMVIHWKMSKELKFDHTTKWYMPKPESVQENETLKVLWAIEIQTNHSTPAREPDFVTVNTNIKPAE